VQANRSSNDLTDDLRRACEQILDRFARIENTAIDPDDWPDLAPDALARLDAYTAEQRRLAALDREAVTALFDQLRNDLHHVRQVSRAVAADRWASASDRHHSAGDRRDSGQDRSDRHATAPRPRSSANRSTPATSPRTVASAHQTPERANHSGRHCPPP
jgi:hypothetical protein